MKKKIEIIPAILENSFSEIEKKIKQVEKLVNFVQVDICDGDFVPNKTIISCGCLDAFLKLKEITKGAGLELDMMVNLDSKIEDRFDKWMNGLENSGAERIIFHFSSTKNWDKVFEVIKKNNKLKEVEFGLAVQINEKEKDYLKVFEKYNFDYIQFMGIEKIGYSGQKLTTKIYKKIESFVEKYPGVFISVDGGVKLGNSKKLKDVGVNRFVSGSGIFEAENINERVEEFKNILK